MQVNDYTIKIEIETVQCSFFRFSPGGERVFASIYEVYGRFDCTCFAITDQYYQSVLDIF